MSKNDKNILPETMEEVGDNVIFINKNGEGTTHREIKKLRLIRAVFIASLAVIVLVCFIVIAANSGWLSPERISLRIIDQEKGRTITDNIPIKNNGLKVSQIDSVGYCIGVLDNMKYTFYSPEMNQLFAYTHNMSSPIAASSNNRVVLYEQGNYSITVLSRSMKIFEKTFDNSLLALDINSANKMIIATTDERYLGKVVVLNSSGDELLTWHSSDYYITNVAISSDGSQFACALMRVENGEIMSKVRLFKLGENTPRAEFNFDGETMVDLSYSANGTLCAVGTASTAFFNTRFEMTGVYEYDNAELSFFSSSIDGCALAFADSFDGYNLVIVNTLADELLKEDFSKISYLCTCEDGYIVCSDNQVFGISKNADTYRSIICSTSDEMAIKVLSKDGKMFILTINGIDLIEHSEPKDDVSE